MKIGIIGDTHINSKREKAIKLALSSVLRELKTHGKLDVIILLGDIFDKYPNMLERVVFAKFLKVIRKHCKKVIMIKGTDLHEYQNSIYNLEDICNLLDIEAYDIYEAAGYTFGHFELAGSVYSNGFKSESKIKPEKGKKYCLGHIHCPQENYLGSVYKTSFAEKDEKKRIALITDGEIEYFPIAMRPMYTVHLEGKEGKVKCKELQLLKDLLKDAEIDLKIFATTDSATLPSIHSNIAKIKAKFNIEYFKEDIEINRVKIDMPDSLDEQELLKIYCKKNKYDFELVNKEIK
ncbi:hypothetical protein LCGC14_0305650 [marine sediment metagenome]|uniref:Calcineurin-like phosphoesterase domain-containing protein n=1 Tax=marine sediment metagenome TaxID=412755 RepID=A0A0F9WAH6_9ZZZZ